MKWYEYEDQERKFLDNIDLLPFLNKDNHTKNLSDIMKAINEQYKDSYPEQFPIFTHLDEQDFYEYLIKRYPKIGINIDDNTYKYTLIHTL